VIPARKFPARKVLPASDVPGLSGTSYPASSAFLSSSPFSGSCQPIRSNDEIREVFDVTLEEAPHERAAASIEIPRRRAAL
jgi:hypothetical protein